MQVLFQDNGRWNHLKHSLLLKTNAKAGLWPAYFYVGLVYLKAAGAGAGWLRESFSIQDNL